MGIPEPYVPKKPAADPAEWRPKDDRDYERVDANVAAEAMAFAPLHYGSLVGREDDIAGIEATARVELIRAMDRKGLYPDQRGIRSHWTLVVEGYGFPMPEGFVHPEAPDEVKADGIRAWKRVVEIASDSLTKYLFVKVWRRRNALPAATKALPSQPIALSGPGSEEDR